ncbi:MAG: methylated-DNA--[protein]-cysteine S-methyltransferase [Limisphaerales bacterium]
MKTNTFTLPIDTDDGVFLAHYSLRGLAALEFPRKSPPPAPNPHPRVPDTVRKWHRMCQTALHQLLAGESHAKIPPLDLAGTAFQKSVWREMRKIASGKTKSYGKIAEAIGNPGAVRAVGGACGANPIPVFVPCHRVLAANKKIGGFSSGLHWKRALLAREGIEL